MDKSKLSLAESLYKDGKANVSEICKTVGVSRATFCRSINPLATFASKEGVLRGYRYSFLCAEIRDFHFCGF